MTANSSAEFAVRPFIKNHPEQMMQQMAIWAESDDLHQRRLASEGCRPRLPWAMALPAFKSDPAPLLPILERLKADESLYVRRSVANSLNDIAKDSPAIVIGIAQNWLGESPEVDWVVKHACLSLVNQAQQEALALFGYGGVAHLELGEFAVDPGVQMGNKLNFSFTLTAAQGALGKLRIEYAIDFVKRNGQQSRKVFKVSESVNSGTIKTVSRSFSFKPISTRNYYPGLHRLSAIVNGQVLASRDFQLMA